MNTRLSIVFVVVVLSHCRLYSFCFAAYFDITRYGKDEQAFDVNIDVGVVEKIADSVSVEEVEVFRSKFSSVFCKSHNPYQMDKIDPKVEFKAFFVFLAMMSILLTSASEDVPEDAAPFLKACRNSLYFGNTTRALAGIYFGVATNDVS